MNDTLKIHLSGRFRIETADGVDLSPKGAKACAVLALLAASPQSERGRGWLQEKLWSDRASEQASSSLRQALFEIRKALGSDHDVLIADRNWVRLDAGRISISEPKAGQVFLDGIEVRDPQFNRWLVARRAKLEQIAFAQNGMIAPVMSGIAPSHRVIFITCGTTDSAEVQWAENLFADCVARTLRESFSTEVVLGPPVESSGVPLHIQVHYRCTKPGKLGLRLTLEDPRNRRQIWAIFREIASFGAPPVDDPDLAQAANTLIDAVADAIGIARSAAEETGDPDQLCRAAIRKMFSMRREDVAEADRLLGLAFDLNPKGVFLAWRAQVRTIQHAERHGLDAKELQQSAHAFAAKAMELDQMNSMVLAAAANAQLYLGKNVIGSLELATRGVKVNAANPLVWWSLSAAKLYTGEAEASYQMATLARKIAYLSPHGFWWDMQKAAAALLSDRLGEATWYFEAAHAQCPEFRPPLRYLTAIYATIGQPDRALLAAGKLSQIEPDFTIDRLVRDRDYPASLLWKSATINMAELGALR